MSKKRRLRKKSVDIRLWISGKVNPDDYFNREMYIFDDEEIEDYGRGEENVYEDTG